MTTLYDDYKSQVLSKVNDYLSKLGSTNIESVTANYTVYMLAELIGAILKLGSMIDEMSSYYHQIAANPEEITTQQKLVPTAGTAVQLPVVLIPDGCEVSIMALSTNTGTIYIGNSELEAKDNTKSIPLLAGQIVEYRIKNLSQLWVNSTVNNDGVMWTVEQRKSDNSNG